MQRLCAKALTTTLALAALTFSPAGAQVRDYPATFVAPRATLPITIDGLAGEEAWTAVRWSDPFVDIRGPRFGRPAYYTRMKVLWDEGYLYIAAILQEPHVWGTLTERDAIIYHDDDFEVFLDPDGDGLAYYELEVNALGTEFDLFLDKPYRDGGRADIPWDMPGLRTAVFLHGTLNDPTDTDDGWSVEIAIPWSDLKAPGVTEPGNAPEADDIWRVNFSRVEWPLVVQNGEYVKEVGATPEAPHPERNWVWSAQGEIDMHMPERWGRLWFVDRLPNGPER